MSNAPETPPYPVIYTAPIDIKLKNLAMIAGAVSGILLFISFIINATVDYDAAGYDILSSLSYVAANVGGGLVTASLLIFAGAVALKGYAR
jgi:hypothetical protein